MVNVWDVTPQFESTGDIIAISEQTPSLFQVYKLSAKHDIGEMIVYRYNQSKTSAAAMSLFDITNPLTGIIKSSTEKFDYEKQTAYDLYFYATNLFNQTLLSNEFHLRINKTLNCSSYRHCTPESEIIIQVEPSHSGEYLP